MGPWHLQLAVPHIFRQWEPVTRADSDAAYSFDLRDDDSDGDMMPPLVYDPDNESGDDDTSSDGLMNIIFKSADRLYQIVSWSLMLDSEFEPQPVSRSTYWAIKEDRRSIAESLLANCLLESGGRLEIVK